VGAAALLLAVAVLPVVLLPLAVVGAVAALLQAEAVVPLPVELLPLFPLLVLLLFRNP